MVYESKRLGELAARVPNAIAAGPFGSNLVGKDYVPSGVPVIRGQNLQGKVISGEFVFVSEEKARSLKSNTAKPGDVVFTQRGTLGQVALVPQTPYSNYVVSQSQMKITVDVVQVSSEFVYYATTTTEFIKQVHDNAVVAGVPHINLGTLRKLTIPLPSRAEQDGIVGVLAALDDKIALLRETNDTLEAIAQALFKSWFVDFDPVRAKAEGRDPEEMPPEVVDLFPGEFEDSDLGAIPKGWKVTSLDSIAEFLNGLAMQKFPVFEETEWMPVIKIAQLRKGDTEGADRASLQVPSEYVVQDGDILFSWSGSLEVEIWCGGTGGLNQHLFKVTSRSYPKWFYYLWTKFHLPFFRETAAHKATTMGHIQRCHLTEAKVVIPPQKLLISLSDTIGPLIQQIMGNRLIIRNLGNLRDTLLPRLMSGKLSATVWGKPTKTNQLAASI